MSNSAAYRLPPTACRLRGFTLIELLVAMTVTIILGIAVIVAYNASMQAYYRTEKNLQALAAFRNSADRLEREVNSIVFKSGVYEWPRVTYPATNIPPYSYSWDLRWDTLWWETRVKYLHAEPANAQTRNWNATMIRSLYQINFRPRYLGYYSTLDGYTIDRSEWYFNSPEDRLVWANGKDDDGDDPDGDAGLRILYDDRGCLMFRKKLDKDMAWAEWWNNSDFTGKSPDALVTELAARQGRAAADVRRDVNWAIGSTDNFTRIRPNDYRDTYHGSYTRASFPPKGDELDRPLSLDDLLASGDIKDSGGNPYAADVFKALPKWHDPVTQEPCKSAPNSCQHCALKANYNQYIVDTGTVIGEGFTDLRFYYIYKMPGSDVFQYADYWPWDDNANPTDTAVYPAYPYYQNKGLAGATIPKPTKKSIYTVEGGTVTTSASGGQLSGVPEVPTIVPFDIDYFTLPIAISAKFTFTVGRQKNVYEKIIFLQGSRWLMYLNP